MYCEKAAQWGFGLIIGGFNLTFFPQFILGANGEGMLMYANEEDNVTEEISKYVNGRYSGSK